MDIHLGYSALAVFFLTVLQSCCGFRCPMPMGNFPMIQSESCEVYWKCSGGMPTAGQCKPGEQFHYMKGMCLPQKQVGCIMQRKILIQLLSRPKPAPMQQPQPKQRPIILYPVPLHRPTKKPTPAPATQAPAPTTTAAPPTPQPWPQPWPFPEPPCGAPPAAPCGAPAGPCGAPPAPPCGAPAPGPCGAPPAPPCGGAPPPFGQFPSGPVPINSAAGIPGFFSFSQNGFQNGVPPVAQRILRRVLG